MNWATWSEAIGMAGTVAFSVTAVLAIQEDKPVDLIAAIIFGVITAVGGGTIRDVILDVPVFWANDLSYIWVSVGSSVAAFYGRKVFERKQLYQAMLYVDGLAVSTRGDRWGVTRIVPHGPIRKEAERWTCQSDRVGVPGRPALWPC